MSEARSEWQIVNYPSPTSISFRVQTYGGSFH